MVSAEDMKMSGIDVKVLAEGGETLPLERFHELKVRLVYLLLLDKALFNIPGSKKGRT